MERCPLTGVQQVKLWTNCPPPQLPLRPKSKSEHLNDDYFSSEPVSADSLMAGHEDNCHSSFINQASIMSIQISFKEVLLGKIWSYVDMSQLELEANRS